MKTLFDIIDVLNKTEFKHGKNSAKLLFEEKGINSVINNFESKTFINKNDKVNSYWYGYEVFIKESKQ